MNFLWSVVSFDVTPIPPDCKNEREFRESSNGMFIQFFALLILGGIMYGLGCFINKPSTHHPTPTASQATVIQGEMK